MSWLQIVLLVIQLLKQFKGAESPEQFVENMQSGGFPFASGDLLKWLWENREQIIEFIKVIVGMLPANPPATTLTSVDAMAELRSLLA